MNTIEQEVETLSDNEDNIKICFSSIKTLALISKISCVTSF